MNIEIEQVLNSQSQTCFLRFFFRRILEILEAKRERNVRERLRRVITFSMVQPIELEIKNSSFRAKITCVYKDI